MEKINQFFKTHKRTILLVSSGICVALILVVFFFATQKTVTIAAEERTVVKVYGFATVATALEKANIQLDEYDQLSTPLDTKLARYNIVCIYDNALKPEQNIPSEFATIQTVETPNGVYTYTKKMDIQATAYSPETCWPYDGTTTANGSSPKEYHTIAAPKTIPFGTLVYIPYFKNAPNGGIFEVEDRGGAIKGNIIDVFFDTYNEAVRFGRRNMVMYILE